MRHHVYFRDTLNPQLAMLQFGRALKEAITSGNAKGSSDCKFWIVNDPQFPLWQSFRIEFTPVGKQQLYKATVRDYFVEKAAFEMLTI